jgi:hypothetical protein
MNIVNGWLFTDVSVAERALAELGIDQTNQWRPFCIKVNEIVGCHPFIENGGEEDGSVILLKGGEEVIINEPFRNLYEYLTMLE